MYIQVIIQGQLVSYYVVNSSTQTSQPIIIYDILQLITRLKNLWFINHVFHLRTVCVVVHIHVHTSSNNGK